MKNKFVLLILGLLLSLPAMMQAQSVTASDCTRAIWPACDGVLHALPRDRYFDDYCRFIVDNNITPQKSNRLKAGNYNFFGETVYVPREVVRQGPTCMVRWFRGVPCPDYAGLCDIVTKATTELQAKGLGCIDSIPVITFLGDSLVQVVVCGKTYTEKLPLLEIPNRFSTQLQSVCEGDSLFWNGEWLKQRGTYFDTLTTAKGQDSILVLNLDVAPMFRSETEKTIAKGDSVEVFGKWVSDTGTYTNNLKTVAGCDSIVTIIVRHTSEKCDDCHQKFRSAAGPFAFVAGGLDARTSYAGQERLRFNRPVASFGGGYEWRWKQGAWPFKKAPCVGQSAKLQLGLSPTPATYVSDRCACDNTPSNMPVTTVVTGGYAVSLLRQWPFVAHAGVEVRGAWNPTHAEEERIEKEAKDFSTNAFVTLGGAYYIRLKGSTFVEPFINLEVPVLKNTLRHWGLFIGGKMRFGKKTEKGQTKNS